MSRIVPQIMSGNRILVLSETLCFNPSDGLKIVIPTRNSKNQIDDNMVVNFVFQYDSETSSREIITEVVNNQVNILIPNFGGILISGLTKPLNFQIANISLSLFFTGMLLSEPKDSSKLMQFSVSIFQDNSI